MKNDRVIIVDVLRGFALFLIILLHFVQNFDIKLNVDTHVILSTNIDGLARKIIFEIASGKAYSVFALLFGFSFFIQMKNKEQIGIDFRWKFLWRLTVLYCIGILDNLFYNGDILHFYALVGLILLALYKLNTRTLWIILVLFIIQLPIFVLLFSNSNPAYEHFRELSSIYSGNAVSIYKTGKLSDISNFNLWRGQITGFDWFINEGRFYQTAALFILGLILARKKIFEGIENYKSQMIKMIIISTILFITLIIIDKRISNSNILDKSKDLFHILLKSYSNIAFSIILVCTFILIYLRFPKTYIFNLFQAYGKMSLTNYVTQSIFGVIFFYGFGLGMYRYLGATTSIIFASGFFFIQALISKWWASKFYYGPLEWIWRALTFLNLKTKFVKSEI